MRGRGYDYSPSPQRYYRSRRRSPSPRGRYGRRGRDDGPTSLLVRNLRHDCRPEDLRGPFGKFGPLKDIYLPRDYYSGEPRGFGFVQFVEPADAEDAKYHMDGELLLGRELTVVFAEENRKKPQEMRQRERVRGRSYDRKLSPSPRQYRRSYSRSPEYYDYSPSPRQRDYSSSPRRRDYSPSPMQRDYPPSPRRRDYPPSPRQRDYPPSPRRRDYSPSPRRRDYSRSISPRVRSYRERSYSMTPGYSRSRSRSLEG